MSAAVALLRAAPAPALVAGRRRARAPARAAAPRRLSRAFATPPESDAEASARSGFGGVSSSSGGATEEDDVDVVATEDPAPTASSSSEIEEKYGDALDNPLFNDAFRQAFIEASERLEEEQAPMRAKIDAEVAEIMARVHAEREAEARGEPFDAAAYIANAEKNVANANALEAQLPKDDAPPTPPPTTTTTETATSADVGELRAMRDASSRQLRQLQNVLQAMESSVMNERLQLEKIELLIRRAEREARYAEAERIARERRETEG